MSKNQISFIEFLWREFMPNRANAIEQNKYLATARSNQSPAKKNKAEFRWSATSKPRELAKVLAVKLPEDAIDFNDSEQDDREEQQINNWLMAFTDSRQGLISRPLKNKKNQHNVYRQTIKNLFAAVKESRARRQEQKWQKQSGLNSLFAYLTGSALVTAIFLTILLPSAARYLAGASDRLTAVIMPPAAVSYAQDKRPISLLKFNQTQLADFIRANANKFPANYFSGQATIILSEQDILGRPVGAAELTSPVTQSQVGDKWPSIKRLIVSLIITGDKVLIDANEIFNNLLSK